MKVSVVSNSTPIIGLASLNQLDLLNQLFDKVYVTRQVFDESEFANSEPEVVGYTFGQAQQLSWVRISAFS